ncbi:MAG TPA: ATP-binding protein [Acidimicrobiales bacterium]|nr:ATP-binding protein [Acidimicrobiales bacterium]
MNSGTGNGDNHQEVLELRGGREDVRAGRRFLTEILIRLGWDERADDAGLLLSELLANVALHAHTPCSVTVTATPERLKVEVEDGSPVLPRVQHFAIDTTTGRGLRLVDQLAESWGVEPRMSGKQVWFCLERQNGGPAASDRATASAGAGTQGPQQVDIDTLLQGWDGWDESDPASPVSRSEPLR